MDKIKVAAIQISPVFLDKKKTWVKLQKYLKEAVDKGAELIVWGETLIPGYPQWVSVSGGASFDNEKQKQTYFKYWNEAVSLDGPIIQQMKEFTSRYEVMLMGGILEKDGSSVYCTLITIKDGELLGRHRKIKPTYEERLVWSDGDGKGIQVYDTKIGKVGGLNCWENWLPLARAALHQMGEVIHVAVWPGSYRNTKDITRFIALEGRSWVISVSGMLAKQDIDHLSDEVFPVKQKVIGSDGYWNNGGSVIVNPKGEIVAGPLIDEEGIIYAELDVESVIKERHNLDISGHYSRFDIFELKVNK
jgi:nitrilase